MSMDRQGEQVALRLENETLRHQNDDLKLILGLVKENVDLRSKLNLSTTASDLSGSTGRKTTLKWQDTLDEGRFRHDSLDEGRFRHDSLDEGRFRHDSLDEGRFRHDSLDEGRFSHDLHQTHKKRPHKTSSPMNLESLTKSSLCTNPQGNEEFANCSQPSTSQKVKDQERLVGEIAFQLDRRILSYVFQCQTRLYGFTVHNIHDKIMQVSTHPVTGKVDEGYRRLLSQRHAELMDRLTQLGYSRTLHPPFTEFIINTYGILKQRPDQYSAQELGYNSPEVLRRVVINTAPAKLLKDLLLLLSCLICMARQDGKPLFLW